MANPNIVELGCAEEYTVIVTARDLVTYAAELSWSSISWSRVLDEVSTASVTIPDVFGGLRCNIEFGDTIVPWRFGLRIERNGSEVWSGPITSITRPERDGAGTDYVEIMASDIMMWMAKRTTTASQLYTDRDGGVVFKGVLDDATQFDNLFDLRCPTFATGFTMTREILALDFEYSLDILSELANSAVDYFVLGKELVVYDVSDAGWFVLRDGVKTRIAATDDPFGRYIYGLFTDDAYVARPGFTIDGMSQANNVFVPGADSGEAGFRLYWQASNVDLNYGLLSHVDVSSLYRPSSDGPIIADAVFQEQADSILALRDGWLTMPPSTLLDTLLLANQFSPVGSPLGPQGVAMPEHADSVLDFVIDDDTLQSILQESDGEVKSMSAALLVAVNLTDETQEIAVPPAAAGPWDDVFAAEPRALAGEALAVEPYGWVVLTR